MQLVQLSKIDQAIATGGEIDDLSDEEVTARTMKRCKDESASDVRVLCESFPHLVDLKAPATSETGRSKTPLCHAAYHDQLDVVKVRLDLRADVSKTCPQNSKQQSRTSQTMSQLGRRSIPRRSGGTGYPVHLNTRSCKRSTISGRCRNRGRRRLPDSYRRRNDSPQLTMHDQCI